MKQFIKEYAAYKINTIEKNKLMRSEIKNESVYQIEKAVRTYERGLITVDECARWIAEI